MRGFAWNALCLLTVAVTKTLAQDASIEPTLIPRAGIVHLVEWPWRDIAKECTSFLGPKQFWAVQVSPPSEHSMSPQNSLWDRYQPVSYELNSRSGSRQEFIDMVTACRSAGVQVIAQVVLNHMTAGNGSSVTGRGYSKYNYSAFGPSDFHQPACLVNNYNDRYNIQLCELFGRADLATGSDHVLAVQAAYLRDLLSIGVSGFCIDSAKNILAAELVMTLGNGTENAGSPYVYSDTVDCVNDDVGPGEYLVFGDFAEYRYGMGLGTVFRAGNVSRLLQRSITFHQWDLRPGSVSVVFLNNVLTSRGVSCSQDVLTYKDGRVYVLAQVFALAWPFGKMLLTSGYRFGSGDEGPPLVAGGGGSSSNSGVGLGLGLGVGVGVVKGNVSAGPWLEGDRTFPSGCWANSNSSDSSNNSSNSNSSNSNSSNSNSSNSNSNNNQKTTMNGSAVAGQWVCEHRLREVWGMIGFRAATRDAQIVNHVWWDTNGGDQLAFGRGSAGFVAINADKSNRMQQQLSTGMAAGRYCQVLSSGIGFRGFGDTSPGGSCDGDIVTVDESGMVFVDIGPQSAFAIHQEAMLPADVGEQASPMP